MSRVKLRRFRFLKNNPHCFYCKTKVNATNSSIDHVIPLSRGGTGRKENMVLSCTRCNGYKGDLLLEEWNKLLPELVKDQVFEMSRRRRKTWRKTNLIRILGKQESKMAG